MTENIETNQIISDKLNIDDSSIINNKKEELMSHLKKVHCKSEERTFDLNEKFNQIKEELQTLMEEYKSNQEKNDSESDEIDFTPMKEYINEYINNERNSLINLINDSFEKINNNIEEMIDDNNSNINQIENILNEIKNEFEQNINDTINHTLEISSQKDDINNKLNIQMKEQFDKVNNLINDEEQNLSSKQIDDINRIKTLINDILKYIKREKIQ
jgi:predicted  nucleic acid-binding Zn-ribbon protein